MTQPDQQNINHEAVATALAERIGTLVRQYETDMALLRSQATDLIRNLENEVQRLQGELAKTESIQKGRAAKADRADAVS